MNHNTKNYKKEVVTIFTQKATQIQESDESCLFTFQDGSEVLILGGKYASSRCVDDKSFSQSVELA